MVIENANTAYHLRVLQKVNMKAADKGLLFTFNICHFSGFSVFLDQASEKKLDLLCVEIMYSASFAW
jgi:hypothetical protein